MSVNRERPHVWVMPEDDANRQLVNGFLKDPSLNVRVLTQRRGCGDIQC